MPGIQPRLYIIAGANGAGKTTFAREYLPSVAECREFVNADLIAGGLAPFAPETAAFRAGRLVLEQIGWLSRRRLDFGFETTLSGRSYRPLLGRLRKDGYAIHLFFLWIPSPELALTRIQTRVRHGGHDVPETAVRRRFQKGLRNLFLLYRPCVDSWTILDNSSESPRMIARECSGTLEICNAALYDVIKQQSGES